MYGNRETVLSKTESRESRPCKGTSQKHEKKAESEQTQKIYRKLRNSPLSNEKQKTFTL